MRRLRWDPTAFFKDRNGLFSRVHCNEMQQISEHGKLQLDTGKQFFFFFLAWQQSTIGAGTWKCCRNSILGHIWFNWLRCWTPAVIGPALNNSTWSPEVSSNPPDFFWTYRSCYCTCILYRCHVPNPLPWVLRAQWYYCIKYGTQITYVTL